MLNPSAFESDVMRDPDGFPVPYVYQGRPEKWAALPYNYRKRRAEEDARIAAEKAARPAQAPRPYATRFTTDYAIEWGRKQGWKLIERERYDHRTKRHHDLEGGVDVIFDDMTDGRVGVQGAGRHERLAHYNRFMAWGGPEKAKRRNLRIFYVEFVRGNKAPQVVEQWA